MTANQIKFAELGETTRHNQQTELEERKRTVHQGTQAAAAWWQAITASSRQKEDARHNLASEQHNERQLSELYRSNLANESIKARANAEAERHNRAGEEVDWFRAQSQDRLNAVEQQYKLRQAAVAERNAASQEQSALASSIKANAELLRRAVAEKELAQRQVEFQETMRANRAREAETQRSNRASESIGFSSISADKYRSELQNTLGYSELAESIRHNTAYENVQQKNATANLRNAYTNRLNARTNQGNLAVNRRNATSKEREASAREFEAKIKAGNSIMSALTGLAATMG